MKKKPSISIIVPCYNEEKNIMGTVASIKEAMEETGRFAGYEILIFDDKSTDRTGEIAEELKKTEDGVKVIHNRRNMGFGYNYTEGVRLASKEYIMMVPGDNEIPAPAIKKIFSVVGLADIIIPYTTNIEVRPPMRRIISKAFVLLFNTLFGLRLRYYNGPCVIKGAMLKKVPMTTHGFAYMASILVRLLKSGASFFEVPMEIRHRQSGTTKAFKVKNIVSVGSEILKLFWEVRVARRSLYSAAARRVDTAMPSA